MNLINSKLNIHACSAFGIGYDKAKRMGVEAWLVLGTSLMSLHLNDSLYQAIVERVNREENTIQQFCHLLFTRIVMIFDRCHYHRAPQWSASGGDVVRHAYI